jgi:hypothetical protein
MTIYSYDELRNADHIDSRDLIETAASLREGSLTEEESELLAAIDELADGIEDWEYGAHFIAGYAFEDYARELAEDIGAIDANASWPNNCIDWETSSVRRTTCDDR